MVSFCRLLAVISQSVNFSWMTSNQAQDYCSGGTRWVESNHADGSYGIRCHAMVFNAQVDGVSALSLETASTTSHDRVKSIHVLGYQTMQFCIRNPMNKFPRVYDDAMQSYCMRNLGLGNCLEEPVPFMKGPPRPGHIWLKVVDQFCLGQNQFGTLWGGITTEQICLCPWLFLLLHFNKTTGFYLGVMHFTCTTST